MPHSVIPAPLMIVMQEERYSGIAPDPYDCELGAAMWRRGAALRHGGQAAL